MTPEEMEKLPKPLERTMTALELSIMDEIIQRIKEAARVTPVIDWLLVRMDAIGAGRARIKQLIGEGIRKAGLQVDDIYEQAVKSDYIRNKAIYEEAGRDYQPYEDNRWLQQVVDAARRQTGHWKTSPRQRALTCRWAAARRYLRHYLNTWSAAWTRPCWESPPAPGHTVRLLVR